MNVIDCLYEPVVVLTKDITMKVSEKNKSVIATNLVGTYLILIYFEIMGVMIYYSNKEELTIDTCNDLKHHAKGKKSNTVKRPHIV